MNHMPFIVTAYVIAIAVPLVFGVAAVMRTRASSRRLDAIDPRRAGRVE